MFSKRRTDIPINNDSKAYIPVLSAHTTIPTSFKNPAKAQKRIDMSKSALLLAPRMKIDKTSATMTIKFTEIRKYGSKYPADLSKNNEIIMRLKKVN